MPSVSGMDGTRTARMRSPGRRRGAAAALLAVLGACGPPEVQPLRQGQVLHPDAANAPPADASLVSGDSLPEGLSPDALQAWKEARDAFLGARTVLRLGRNRGDGPDLFGMISDARIDARGNIVVFDQQAQEVRVFDSGGRHLGGFGGHGDGPLELRDAFRFEVLADGRIAVPVVGRRVKVFAPAGTGWELDETFALPANALDMCASSHGQLYFSGPARSGSGENTVVHRVSMPGGEAASFGEGYRHDEWIVRSRMSEGLVGCPNRPDRVVFGFHILPVIRAYSADGSVIWTAKVTDHIPMRVIETQRPGGGSSVTRLRQIDHDILTEVYPLPSGHIFVQYTRFLPKGRNVEPRSFLLDAASGAGAFLGEGDVLPAVSAVYPDGYIALFNDPYPYVEVRAADGRTWPGSAQ